jgi:hypothetical protein
MMNSRILGVVAAASLWAPLSAQAVPKPEGCFANLQVENDLFGGGSDRHYTHGMRLSVAVPAPAQLDVAPETCLIFADQARAGGDILQNLFGKLFLIPDRTRHVEAILGQSMFTPENVKRTDLVAGDRPYAGWLYFGLALSTERDRGESRTLDNFELDIGVIGPMSFARDVQNAWHDWIGADHARGWDHQLKNEVGVLALYERKFPFPRVALGDFEAELMPSAGFALGNVYTYGSAGVTLRFGGNIPFDYGPPRIRPGLHGSSFTPAGSEGGFGWYLFAGIEGRAVARNIFLDGNTFRNSHSVEKHPFVGDLQVGLVLRFDWGNLAFTNIFRTREFDGQRENDEFGSINLSVRF